MLSYIFISICDNMSSYRLGELNMIKKIFNTKTIIFLILVVILLFLIPKLTELIMLLFAAYVIAAALNPFVNVLEKKIKNRAISALAILSTTLFVLIALLFPIIAACYKEIELFVTILPHKITTIYNIITSTKLYGKTIASYIPMANLANSTPDIAQNLFSQSWNVTMAAGQTIFVGLALAMFIYYILVDKKYLITKFIEFFPPKLKSKAEIILYNITTKVGNYVRAQVLSMVTVGIMVTLEVALLKIDYPILLGLIAGICEIIPVLGPSIAIGVIVVVGFQLGLGKIILAVILFLVIQQVSNYIIRPFLFGKFMQLHPINIMVALFVAERFLGVWGVILSPAIAATICVLIDELYLKQINDNEQETKTPKIEEGNNVAEQ